MYGLTRGMTTLLGAAVAGFLVWLATQISDGSNGGYWAVYGLIAAAGLTMALSQLLGGWTKWGFPRLSVNVFLIGFIPVLVAAGWVLLATQPETNWFRDHIRGWTNDIGIQSLVADLGEYVPVLAFGIGLVFGFTFDTSGPSGYGPFGRRRRAATVPAGGAAPPAEDAATAREEREAAYDGDLERDRGLRRERALDRDRGLSRDRDVERDGELDRDRTLGRDDGLDRERDLDRERELDRERDLDRERELDRDRVRTD